MNVTCPQGSGPGSKTQVEALSGGFVEVELPEGTKAGEEFQVQVSVTPTLAQSAMSTETPVQPTQSQQMLYQDNARGFPDQPRRHDKCFRQAPHMLGKCSWFVLSVVLACLALWLKSIRRARRFPSSTPSCKKSCFRLNGDCTCEPYGCESGCPGYGGFLPTPPPTPPPTPDCSMPHSASLVARKCALLQRDHCLEYSTSEGWRVCGWGGACCLPYGTTSCEMISTKLYCSIADFYLGISCDWGGSSCLTRGNTSCEKITNQTICSHSHSHFGISCDWGGSSCSPYGTNVLTV